MKFEEFIEIPQRNEKCVFGKVLHVYRFNFTLSITTWEILYIFIARWDPLAFIFCYNIFVIYDRRARQL